MREGLGSSDSDRCTDVVEGWAPARAGYCCCARPRFPTPHVPARAGMTRGGSGYDDGARSFNVILYHLTVGGMSAIMNRPPSAPTLPSALPGKRAEHRAIGRLDRLAIGLSSLCVLHCIATVILAATLASAGAALADPAWHEIGFALAMVLGAVALGRGFAAHRKVRPLLLGVAGLTMMGSGLAIPHGAAEIACTVAGVLLLAIAHRLNAGHHRHVCAGARRAA